MPAALATKPAVRRPSPRVTPAAAAPPPTAAPRATTWVAGIVIAALTWPIQGFTTIQGGDDGSWVIGLHMAVHQGLHFGRQVAWSYGPLGFLTLPELSFPLLGALSLAYAALVHGALGVSATWAARRVLPLPPALVVTLAVCVAVPVTHSDDRLSATVVVVAFIVCIAVLRRRDAAPRAAWLFPIGAGLVSGLEALIRLNAGLTVVLLCAVTSAVAFPRSRVRSLALFAGALVVSVAGLWLGSGQAATDFPVYVLRSSQLVSGFSQALMKEGPAWHYLAAALATVAVAVSARAATRDWPPVARAAAALLTALLMFSAFKQGFVRHDESHTPFFFACAIAAVLAFGWSPRRAPIGLVALGALIATLLVVARPSASLVAPPARSPLQGVDQLRALLAPSGWIHQARLGLQAQEGLDPATIASLRGRSVHVWPKEAAVAWAYPQVDWLPLPVMQTRMTYAPALDRADAKALQSRSGPARVLRSPQANPFDAPLTATALFCRFVEVHATPRWEVLARAGDRCGPERLIARVETSTRKHIDVPSARGDEMVVMRVHGLEPGALHRVQAFLYKGTKWSARTGRDGDKLDLAPATASGPTIVSVPPKLDYPGRFARTLAGHKLSVLAEPPTPGDRKESSLPRLPLTVDFYAVRLLGPAVRSAGPPR